MAEYIEREAAIDLLSEPITMSMCLSVSECLDKIAQRRIDLDLIKSIPTADVQPVVRCKDCVHSIQGKKSLECEKHQYTWNTMNRWVNEDDFCCWGAKKEREA